MSKITRPDADVVAFGSQAQSGERTVFGDDTTVSDDLTLNLNTDFIRGWAAGLDPANGFPPMEYFSGQMFTTSQLVSYLFQMGISEWNEFQFYPENSRSMDSSGTVWKSLQDNTGQSQVEGIYWTDDLGNYVAKIGDEVIAGIKTFSSSPIVPAPTTDFQSANKKYVDDNTEETWVADDTRAKTALNATGTAPIYACRSWVNFNGTGVVAIRDSGNVSSVGDVGVGTYSANTIVPLPSANASVCSSTDGSGFTQGASVNAQVVTSSSITIDIRNFNGTRIDSGYVHLAVFI